MKRSLLALGFACFGILLSALPATAQQQEGQRPRGGFGGGGGRGFGFSETTLLGNEQVQKELEISADQTAKITKIREESRAQFAPFPEGFRDLPEAERTAKMTEMRTKNEAAMKEIRGKINEVLLPDQRERLKELAIQAQGTGALFNPETAEALKLTDEQKKKLETIREESAAKMRELFSGGRGQGGPNEEARTKMAEIRKESGDKSLAVLTTEQAAQFEKMKGEKSSIDFTQMRGGPGGGRGGRPGGNGGANN
jgi:Spy/CpxP family protein refolding chaperone